MRVYNALIYYSRCMWFQCTYFFPALIRDLCFRRRGGLMASNVLSFAAAAFLGLAKTANSFAMILIGRVLIGIFVGECTCVRVVSSIG